MAFSTVSIIGTAGGKETGALTSTLFERMVDRARSIITKDFGLNPENVILVSGGAAWSDHVAVELYLQGATRPDVSLVNVNPPGTEPSRWGGLQIYFPCPWLVDRVAHLDNGQSGWMANPGRLANKLHTTFANRMGRSTQADFFAAQSRGAILSNRSGFHARNAVVAESQYLIAFTFGPNMEEYRGGTAHTWNLCRGYKQHVSLETLD